MPVQHNGVVPPAETASSAAEGETSTAETADPATEQQADPPPVPVKPVISWKPSGIGYPLVPSDPTTEQKTALLTFDDGPTAQTPAVLDALKAKGVKAVFFVTGYGAKQHPEMLERIHQEGHILGIHTMSHHNLTKLTREQQRQEIQPLAEQIEKVTGKKARYIRPPFGAYNDELLSLLKEMDLELINWSVGSLDWEGVVDGYKDPQRVVADVDAQLHKGAVILMHDTMKHTTQAVPMVIDRLRAEGYEFVLLP